MKIQIDTNAKTVKVLDSVNLSDLVKALKTLLGEDYKEYTFEGGHSVYLIWTSPIVIPYYIERHQPYYDYNSWPQITCSAGTYNVEVKEYTTT